jgi:uncharacterized phage protein (TIGR02220 family)
MDLSRGCILLARSLDESDIFQNEKWLKVFIWCLIQANHKGKNVPVNIGRSMTSVWVERGQFIFGRHKAAEKLGMSPSTVRNIMQKLVDLKNMDMQKDTHFSIVTIRDYDFYQNMENYKGQAKGQPEDSQRTADGQPEDTTNTQNTPKNDKHKESIVWVVNYLNKTCGTKYRSSSQKTSSLIKARINEGFEGKDFKTVIDNKYSDWKGTDQEKYLRPETLFGTKFEGYLNQKKKGTNENLTAMPGAIHV